MSVDTPARIAIVGAGPVGLEAALYARYLGYEVNVYEEQAVCENVLPAGDAILPHAAGENRTSLGLAALRAQSEDAAEFDPTAKETARALVESYFLPLAGTDLLVDCIHVGSTVLRIERTDFPDDEEGAESSQDLAPQDTLADDSEFEEYEELEYAPFELLIRKADGSEFTTLAEVVIDASGSTAASPILLDTLRIQFEQWATASGAVHEFQTAEPNYYVLGAKSMGAAGAFTIPSGHDQIRRLFAIVGGRESLNLYATFKNA